MSSHKKRERTQNWTQEEKILLLQLCGNKINILESKKADQYTLNIKTNVWKDIHSEFIAKVGTDRDILRLKEQWQRMKKQAKAELRNFKLQIRTHGEQFSQVRKISSISEEVLKIMEVASKMNQEEEDGSLSSSENSEQDNTLTYFCETEVKQEQDDKPVESETIKTFHLDDSEASLSSLNIAINSQPKLNYNDRRDTILNLLSTMYQQNDQEDPNTSKHKRKMKDDEEYQFLRSLFESKHKEHQKRLCLIDEQFKTAKIQKETAEIQKHVAQQELKQLLLQAANGNGKEKKSFQNISGQKDMFTYHKEMRDMDTNTEMQSEIYQKLHFHHSQIQLHEEEIEKHKQQIADLIKKE